MSVFTNPHLSAIPIDQLADLLLNAMFGAQAFGRITDA